MSNSPNTPNRRSNRLPDYDYYSAGAYFVTICVQHRECLFGAIVDDDMKLNDAGRMIQMTWNSMPKHLPVVLIDEFVVMPNHFHGILIIEPGSGSDIHHVSGNFDHVSSHFAEKSWHENQGEHKVHPYGTDENSLGRVIQMFKSLTTLTYAKGVTCQSWPRFSSKLWQRNYYDRVIRNNDELDRARDYVVNNPMKWALDRENPVYFQ
jgi:putative transposase